MENITFEEGLNRLQAIVKRLENGELPLQESLELFEEGIGLFRFCQSELQKAEGRMAQLVKSLDEGWELAPVDL